VQKLIDGEEKVDFAQLLIDAEAPSDWQRTDDHTSGTKMDKKMTIQVIFNKTCIMVELF
jgi:hypothetical protein